MTSTGVTAAAKSATAPAVPQHLNFIQEIELKGEQAIAEVKAGLTYLGKEAKIGVAWVEKEVPGSAGAIAVFFQGAEAEAANLAQKVEHGLGDQITAGGAEMETFMANLINGMGLSTNTKTGMKAIDASGIALAESIGKSLVSTALASIIAKLAPSAIALAL